MPFGRLVSAHAVNGFVPCPRGDEQGMAVTELDVVLSCALCTQPAVEVLPVSGSPQDRPGVPLCVSHRREWINGTPVVGWCSGGSHYGRRSLRCDMHGLMFDDPLT